MMTGLPDGLYEQIVDLALEGAIAGSRTLGKVAELKPLDPGESHVQIARHLERILSGALESLGTRETRLEEQCDLANEILALVARRKRLEHMASEARIAVASRLLSVYPARLVGERPARPVTPLSDSFLFTGSRGEPELYREIQSELLTADRVDILVSFVKWSGIRLIMEALGQFTARPGTRLRVITTSYIGATEYKAVDFLAKLPKTEVRISYDTRITRLHAKAYLFVRETGFHTAYVGSSNLSNPAMTEGLEWNLKVSSEDSPHILEKIRATFETYWEEREFRPFDPEKEEDRTRLDEALKEARGGREEGDDDFTFYELRPFDFQEEILERLEVNRKVHGRWRNLVVAATGTGKTVVAAFDYRRFAQGAGRGVRPRLLFVAHREEILKQSLRTFRQVLRDANFGELLVGGSDVRSHDHLFVSIQSFNSRGLAERLPRDHYDYIVVDEFHHGEAPSYRRLFHHFEPQIILGLTATPERSDAKSAIHDEFFGGEIDAEIRLPEAVQRRLLAPFHYFGVSDEVDLSGLRWRRGGYDTGQLEKLVTGNDIRAQAVVDAIVRYVARPREMRALCFCVSKAHAHYMSRKFRDAGLPAIALDADSERDSRRRVQQQLVRGEIAIICVVDLYNEGVDIPEVDTVLFLRPTESLTVFLQQLGRGLRIHAEKECLTVLDFIGQAHREFRFAPRFRALCSRGQQTMEKEIEDGFPHLPAGCHILLEKVAREHILENIRQSILSGKRDLVKALREWAVYTDLPLTLGNFLRYHQLDLTDIYRRGTTWSGLQRAAGILKTGEGPDEKELAKGLHRLHHVNAHRFLETCLRVLDENGPCVTGLTETQQRHALMLHYLLWRSDGPSRDLASIEESFHQLYRNRDVYTELREVLRLLLHHVDHTDLPLELPYLCPLELHARYTREEIFAALGEASFEKMPTHREGAMYIRSLHTDVLFVTLNKDEKGFSPQTMYKDYAVSRELFHWESRHTISRDSPTGQRYIGSTDPRGTVLLFVREDQKNKGLANAFTFLGPATCVSHEGVRPVRIMWRLSTPMPASLWAASGRLALGA